MYVENEAVFRPPEASGKRRCLQEYSNGLSDANPQQPIASREDGNAVGFCSQGVRKRCSKCHDVIVGWFKIALGV